MHKRNDEFIGYVVTMNATIGEQTDGDQQQYQVSCEEKGGQAEEDKGEEYINK